METDEKYDIWTTHLSTNKSTNNRENTVFAADERNIWFGDNGKTKRTTCNRRPYYKKPQSKPIKTKLKNNQKQQTIHPLFNT